jgi:O-antigen ligase
MWIAPLGVIICAVGRWFLPVPENMLAIRYVATPYVPENLNKAAIWMAALVLVPLTIVAWSAIEPRTPRWVMGSFIGGVALSAAISVTDLLQVTSIATSLGYDSNNSRQTGLTDHPNTLGFTCAISLPIAIFFMARRGRVTWIASRLAIVILLGGVVACGSRGTQFAAPIIILATLMSAPERRRAALKNVAITLAVSTAALFVLVETLASNVLGDLFRFSTGGTGVGDSDAERAILLKQAINDVESYPVFGVGLRHIVEAHNIYLQILASGGLVLGFAMLAYWIGVISSCWQLRARGSYLGACLLISMLTWLGLGTIENQLTDRLLYFTVGSVAALVSVVQSAEKEAYLRGAWLR